MLTAHRIMKPQPVLLSHPIARPAPIPIQLSSLMLRLAPVGCRLIPHSSILTTSLRRRVSAPTEVFGSR